ncbi:MAG TPA: HlyD family secretion protein [Candidatus Acidoferrales bacterium]|nr:HlyD family secretion protein [Candidatus Acidoferrales bacterium]
MTDEQTTARQNAAASEPASAATGVGPGEPARRRGNARKRIVFLGIGLAVVAVAALLYFHFAGWQSTDDAEIDGYIYPVSSRVTGYVTRVTVDDNQYVKAGAVLVQLDPKDYEVAVANARATLENDQASAAATMTNVPLTSVNTSSQLATAQAAVENAEAGLIAAEQQSNAAEASLRELEAKDLNAQDDVSRYRPLAAKDEIPQQTYTHAVDSQRATAAGVASLRASAAAAKQAVAQARARLAQAQAELRYARTRPEQISVQRSRAAAAEAEAAKARAILQQSRLNLEYTTIVAPVSGIVGRRTVQPGQNVSPGQQLMTIVPLDSPNIWVTANFKETQLTRMRPGQPVRISVDTYGRTYNGRVLDIAGATGARYSLLPPENATGNYVKVVQRIPVRIVFDEGQDPSHLLRPGMSVEADVRVK